MEILSNIRIFVLPIILSLFCLGCSCKTPKAKVNWWDIGGEPPLGSDEVKLEERPVMVESDDVKLERKGYNEVVNIPADGDTFTIYTTNNAPWDIWDIEVWSKRDDRLRTFKKVYADTFINGTKAIFRKRQHYDGWYKFTVEKNKLKCTIEKNDIDKDRFISIQMSSPYMPPIYIEIHQSAD